MVSFLFLENHESRCSLEFCSKFVKGINGRSYFEIFGALVYEYVRLRRHAIAHASKEVPFFLFKYKGVKFGFFPFCYSVNLVK